jgi:hypothetical protein
MGTAFGRTVRRFRGRRAAVVLTAGAAVLLVGGGSVAFAVSGGGYSPHQQGCQPGDSDYATPAAVNHAGCHNTALNIESGGTTQGTPNDNNTTYAQLGVNQSPNDPKSPGTQTPYSLGVPGSSGSPHALCVAANTDGTNSAPASTQQKGGGATGCGSNPKGAGVSSGIDYYQVYCPVVASIGHPCEAAKWGNSTITPQTGSNVAYQPLLVNGMLVYLGMDDNSDNGEHDGLGPYSIRTQPWNSGAQNGPSDGGAIMLTLTPLSATNAPSPTHPEGAANGSTGFCADGICAGATTKQQTVYHGCGAADAYGNAPCGPNTPQNADVYDYAPGGNPGNDPSVNTESANCNSGDPSSTNQKVCGVGGMNALRSATPANENVEPGVQLYTDPDPQRSPAAPAPLWPTPAVYVGTCGVYLGSPATTGPILGTSGTPVSNRAGQIAITPIWSTQGHDGSGCGTGSAGSRAGAATDRFAVPMALVTDLRMAAAAFARVTNH